MRHRIRTLVFVALLVAPRAVFAVTVSSITVATNVVTVNATSHGFVVNQGICITATAACAVVATVPNGNSFTFTQPSNVTVNACASTCGTALAAPQIVVLEMAVPDQAHKVPHVLFWLTTLAPVAKTYTSRFMAGPGSTGATTAQNNALAAGSFIEQEWFPSLASSMSTSEMQITLQREYGARQAALAANTQPGTFYGSVWDGTAWGTQ